MCTVESQNAIQYSFPNNRDFFCKQNPSSKITLFAAENSGLSSNRTFSACIDDEARLINNNHRHKVCTVTN